MAPRARRNRSGDAGALRASGAPLGAGQQLHGAEAVCAHITSLHEAVRNHAYGFEATLLFCHTVALLVQLHTLYRSRMPPWSNSLVLATVASLSKYLLLRFARPVPGLPLRVQLLHNQPLLGVLVVAVLVLGYALAHLGMQHSPLAVGAWCLPIVASAAVYNLPFPPLPDLHVRPPGQPLCSLCFSTIMFRLAEATYLTGLLPILMNQHPFLYYNRTHSRILIIDVLVTSSVLLLAETFALNRMQLFLESLQRGYWKSLGLRAPPDAENIEAWSDEASYAKGTVVRHRRQYYGAAGEVTHCEPGTAASWLAYHLFSREGGHPKTSRLLLLLSIVQAVVMLSQLLLLLRSLQWIPYAAMLIGSSGGVVLISSSTSGPASIDCLSKN